MKRKELQIIALEGKPVLGAALAPSASGGGNEAQKDKHRVTRPAHHPTGGADHHACLSTGMKSGQMPAGKEGQPSGRKIR